MYFIPATGIVTVGNNFTSCDSFNPSDFPHSKTIVRTSQVLSFDSPVRGHYFTVYLEGARYLKLMEVEVYGLLASGKAPCLFFFLEVHGASGSGYKTS